MGFMRNITLTTNEHTSHDGPAKVLVNWDNVNWATPRGDAYVELNFGTFHTTTVMETLKEIEEKLK